MPLNLPFSTATLICLSTPPAFVKSLNRKCVCNFVRNNDAREFDREFRKPLDSRCQIRHFATEMLLLPLLQVRRNLQDEIALGQCAQQRKFLEYSGRKYTAAGAQFKYSPVGDLVPNSCDLPRQYVTE